MTKSLDTARLAPADGGKLPLAGFFAGLWLLLVDAPTRVGLGPISASGVLTLFIAAVLIFLSIVRGLYRQEIGPAPRRYGVSSLAVTHRLPMPLGFFLLFSLGWILVNPTFAAVQNVAVYCSFIFAIIVGSLYSRACATTKTLTFMRACGAISALLFITSDTLGIELYGIRSIGLSGLVALSVIVPHRSGGVWSKIAPFVVVYAILISLSRTALLIALVLLIFLIVRSPKKSRLFRGTALVLTCCAFVYVLFFTYEPLRDRFLGGDGGVSVGGVKFNTSGRSTLWDMTWTSALESPWLGHGPGSASNLIAAVYPNISHPHNDYLRIFHDFGIVGFTLFLLGIIVLLVLVAKRATRLDGEIHWSALLSLVVVLISAITDNVVIYSFVMMPIGFLVGLSLKEPLPSLKAPATAWNASERANMCRLLSPTRKQK